MTHSSFGQVNKDSLDVHIKNLGQDLMKEKQSVGLSIGVYNDGKTYFYNFGTTEKGKETNVTENTVYEIGSITKTFMSFLLAKAVTEKKVTLNDDIRKYLDGEYPNLEYSNKPDGSDMSATIAQICNLCPQTRSKTKLQPKKL